MAAHRIGPRRVVSATVLSLTVLVLGSMWHPHATLAAGPLALPVDRQDYVSDTGPDIYQAEAASEGDTSGQDPVDIHVQAIPSQTTYHSLIHIPTEAIPANASVQSLVVTLFPTTNPNRAPAENANTSAAVIDAWPLKTELAINFDPNNPPAADTSGPEVVGKLNDKDGSWSFDLAPMLAYWQKHGDTGAAIVPDAGGTTQPWSIGFDRTLSSATAVLSSTSDTGGIAITQPVSGPSATVSNGGGLPRTAAVLPAATGANAVPTPAPSAAATATPQPGAARAGATPAVLPPAAPAPGIPLWLLMLAVSATAAVALLAQPVAQALAATGGVLLGLRSQLRLHPRMFAVAGAMLVWSSGLSVYANTMGRTPASPGAGSVASAAADNGSGSTATGGSASSTPGATPSASAAAGAAAAGAAGAGTAAGAAAAGGRPVYPNAPNPPSASLFAPSEDTVGLTDTNINLCAHAALTFGPAFNINASDLNVFWQMVNDQGGIWGRKVTMTYQDDGYQPSKAVTAAQACMDQSGGSFFLLSGIGFDQIPAVRVWAEQHHVLYLHHIATQQGTAGLRYSYTMLPTLEQVGVSYGQYYLAHDSGMKIGEIYRNSSNWDPGRLTFEQTLGAAGQGGNIVDREAVNNNQGDYSAQLVKMRQAGAQVVLIWENALAATEIIQQANNQTWDPHWILFPFNLTLKTLDQAGVDTSHMEGLVPWPAYTCNASNLPQFSAYRAEIQAFEAAYAKYDNQANLCGDGGDLLFGTWEAWRQVYDLLYQCGPNCTRNKVAGLMLTGYHATVGANCAVDFRNGDGHHGGGPEDAYKVGTINGSAAWYNTAFCETQVR